MPRRDIGGGSQTALERVLPHLMEEGVERIAREAWRFGSQTWRQLQRRNGGVQPGAEEEGRRTALCPCGRADNAVHCRLQVAVGCQFKEFTDVDDEGIVPWRGVDPSPIGRLDLQTAVAILQYQREQAAILMRTDALFGVFLRTARITDELEQLMR